MKPILLAIAVSAAAAPVVFAAGPAPTATPAAPAGARVEKVNVDALKQKYWENASDGELRIVQNRQFTKARRLELQLFGGFMAADPFLSVRGYGLGAGYHFTEHFGFGALYMKYAVGRSSALERLETEVLRTANTNPQKSTLAGEFTWSPLYGKLSWLGLSIIHYDLHFLFGGGTTNTVNGNYLTFHAGIGQQVYLSKSLALRIDYRLMRYTDDVVQRSSTLAANYNQVIGTRTSYTDAFTIGLGWFF